MTVWRARSFTDERGVLWVSVPGVGVVNWTRRGLTDLAVAINAFHEPEERRLSTVCRMCGRLWVCEEVRWARWWLTPKNGQAPTL